MIHKIWIIIMVYKEIFEIQICWIFQLNIYKNWQLIFKIRFWTFESLIFFKSPRYSSVHWFRQPLIFITWGHRRVWKDSSPRVNSLKTIYRITHYSRVFNEKWFFADKANISFLESTLVEPNVHFIDPFLYHILMHYNFLSYVV